MFVRGKLILQHYIPDKIVPGMWFLALQHKDVVLYEPKVFIDNPEQYEAFVQLNGYPVRPHIYYEGDPNIPESSYLLVGPEQIGWFDEGSHTDELRDISMKELNNILEDEGYCQIEIEEDIEYFDDDEAMEGYDIVPAEDETGRFIATLLQGKCTIRYIIYDDFEDDDDEEEYEDDEEDCDDYDNMCGSCSGTGMGQWEGTSCTICGGSGEIKTHNKEWDDY
jgi:hypothetical protein